MLFSPQGQPVPPSDITALLQRVDANLGIMWLPNFTSGEARIDGDGRWAITYKWAPTDRRWAFIQRGEWDRTKDFDIICFLPPDCPVEQAFGFFENGLRHCGNADAAKLCERAHQERAAHRHAIWQDVVDQAVEHVEREIVREHIPFSAGGL